MKMLFQVLCKQFGLIFILYSVCHVNLIEAKQQPPSQSIAIPSTKEAKMASWIKTINGYLNKGLDTRIGSTTWYSSRSSIIVDRIAGQYSSDLLTTISKRPKPTKPKEALSILPLNRSLRPSDFVFPWKGFNCNAFIFKLAIEARLMTTADFLNVYDDIALYHQRLTSNKPGVQQMDADSQLTAVLSVLLAYLNYTAVQKFMDKGKFVTKQCPPFGSIIHYSYDHVAISVSKNTPSKLTDCLVLQNSNGGMNKNDIDGVTITKFSNTIALADRSTSWIGYSPAESLGMTSRLSAKARWKLFDQVFRMINGNKFPYG